MSKSLPKCKWRFGVPAALTLIAFLAVLFWPGEKEPEYQGKKLSEWVEMARNPDTDFNQRRLEQGEAAVRSIGTNALPLLLKWVNYAPARWKLKLSATGKKLPFSDLGDDFGSWLTKKDERHFTVAIKSFQILGPLAAPALPRLKEIAAEKNARYGAEIMRTAASIEVWVQMEERRAQADKWE